ncbi:type II secretion system minor pseudopilin GspI [Kangiella sp.]|uniref:type II secretion system minor pseudopilin GspI n=1 Tax=Kangiella sp. TaxID=1920245 RepID=UPI003A92677F
MKSRMGKQQKGLSLLELLIALAVFAIFITPMLTGLYAASVTAIGNAKEKTLASYIAQNHLAELQLKDDWPSIGRKQGEVEFAGQEWRWEHEVVNTADENMRRVTVVILTGEQGSFSMIGFVGKKEKR